MKTWTLIAVLALASSLAFSQEVLDPHKQPDPKLDTAYLTAIRFIEGTKQSLAKQFQDSQKQEADILAEWKDAHPGWHINAQTFAVEKDTPEKPVDPPKDK
jgi:succinylarginine dihydrolase